MNQNAPTIPADQLAQLIGGTQDDGEAAFQALLATAATELGTSNWATRDSSKNEGFVVEAASPLVANEIAAVRAHAAEQIKYWSAKKEQAEKVVKDAALAAAEANFPDEESAPKVITFKANGVTIATYNLSADSRVLDQAAVKALFPDTPDNAQVWKTQPGSRRLLFK
jgi:hypothetical protein